jgi:predicted  nucleic acid-binding Zn-ribbon protein
MDSTNDLTVQILIEMRDELRKTNARLDKLSEDLERSLKEVRDEQARTRQDLGRRIDQTNLQLKTTEARIATEISALRAVVTERDDRSLEERVSQCERDIVELRTR